MNDAAFLELSDGSVAMIDYVDVPRVVPYDWQGPHSGERYVVGLDFTDGRCPDLIFLHRLIADAGPDDIVTHRNGDTLDNRRDNLVVMSRARPPLPAAIRPAGSEEALVAD